MNGLKRTAFAMASLTAFMVSADWYVEVGPFYRGGMEVQVDGGSRASDSGVQIARPGVRGAVASVKLPGVADDGTVQILRVFEDGFVGPSGFPLFSNLGQTQFFGFQSDSQYDAGAGTLTYTRTQTGASQAERTQTTLSSSGGAWEDRGDVEGYGLQAKLGRILLQQKRLDVSAQLQLGWLGGLNRSLGTESAFRQDVRQTTRQTRAEQTERTQFVYDTFNNPVFPTGPYEMESPEGIGPMISDRPISIGTEVISESDMDRIVGRRSVVAHSQVNLQSEADLFVLGFGPRIRVSVSDEFSLFVQGGGTLNLLDARIRRDERFVTDRGQVIGQWNDRADEQKWLWGASISVGGQWALNDKLSLSASGGYDWVESTSLDIGPDRVRYDLSGYQVEVSLGWSFGGGAGE